MTLAEVVSDAGGCRRKDGHTLSGMFLSADSVRCRKHPVPKGWGNSSARKHAPSAVAPTSVTVFMKSQTGLEKVGVRGREEPFLKRFSLPRKLNPTMLQAVLIYLLPCGRHSAKSAVWPSLSGLSAALWRLRESLFPEDTSKTS